MRARWNKHGALWGYRPGTLLFYGVLTLLSITVILFLIITGSRPRRTALETGARLEVLLDAGHGGMDGGAVSPEGVCEAPITLSVSRKTQLLLGFAGVSAGMVREDEGSLDFSPEASARQNKNADLNARLALARSHPECPFLSIHLNQFSQTVYSGAQVFYSPNHPKSVPLAETLQKTLRQALDPANDRKIKPAPEGVFLMKNITAPAVTIECGFLSNPEECTLLQQETYQTKIALAIACGYLESRG